MDLPAEIKITSSTWTYLSTGGTRSLLKKQVINDFLG